MGCGHRPWQLVPTAPPSLSRCPTFSASLRLPRLIVRSLLSHSKRHAWIRKRGVVGKKVSKLPLFRCCADHARHIKGRERIFPLPSLFEDPRMEVSAILLFLSTDRTVPPRTLCATSIRRYCWSSLACSTRMDRYAKSDGLGCLDSYITIDAGWLRKHCAPTPITDDPTPSGCLPACS